MALVELPAEKAKSVHEEVHWLGVGNFICLLTDLGGIGNQSLPLSTCVGELWGYLVESVDLIDKCKWLLLFLSGLSHLPTIMQEQEPEGRRGLAQTASLG
jgi:hypothetical protein